jgi:hypothetical protein
MAAGCCISSKVPCCWIDATNALGCAHPARSSARFTTAICKRSVSAVLGSKFQDVLEMKQFRRRISAADIIHNTLHQWCRLRVAEHLCASHDSLECQCTHIGQRALLPACEVGAWTI